jgi:hypothetical protein
MEWIIELLLQAFFEVVCYWIGRVLLPIVSFGTARAEKFRETTNERNYIYRRRAGMIVFSMNATIVFGLLVLVLLGVAAYFIYRA